MRELLFPDVERRLADPHLPTHVRRRRPALYLPERIRNLLLAELRPLHWPSPCRWSGPRSELTLVLTCPPFLDQRQLGQSTWASYPGFRCIRGAIGIRQRRRVAAYREGGKFAVSALIRLSEVWIDAGVVHLIIPCTRYY